MSRTQVITLLTDFGTADPFVGVMKGVILQRCPAARIVDLTHEIPPQDVHRAGYVLADSWRYFPPGTIHIAVVDPGVGSDRAILLASVADQWMLAPDNALLTAVFADCPPTAVWRVTNRDIFLKSISATFHGRDIFAPTAGALAAGMPPEDVGHRTGEWLMLELPHPRPRKGGDGGVDGEVIYVDRFGNLVTNIRGTDLPVFPRIEAAGRVIEGLSRSYAVVRRGEAAAVIGSTGRLEIAVNHGSAAEVLGVGTGTPVRVSAAKAAGKEADPYHSSDAD